MNNNTIFYVGLSASLIISLLEIVLSLLESIHIVGLIFALILLTVNLTAFSIHFFKLKVKIYWLCCLEINIPKRRKRF